MIPHYSAGQMKMPERKCPEGFHTGKPNLIVCPKVDMWRTILSIYMQSPDQGLPTTTEVLVCCESTTKEEVELLLRRALQTPTEKGGINHHYCCSLHIMLLSQDSSRHYWMIRAC